MPFCDSHVVVRKSATRLRSDTREQQHARQGESSVEGRQPLTDPRRLRVAVVFALLFATHQSEAGQISIVSNAADWRESTQFIDSNTNDHPWSGTPQLPDLVTFSLTPTIGGFADHIDKVPGAESILARRGIRYFHTLFTLPAFGSLTADVMLSVDNDIQVFVNRHPLALEGSGFSAGENFNDGIHHRLFVDATGSVINGYQGGQIFDSFPSSFDRTNWISGTNELLIAVRNASPPVQSGDLGGVSFRIDIETSTVPEPNSLVLAWSGTLLLMSVCWCRRFMYASR